MALNRGSEADMAEINYTDSVHSRGMDGRGAQMPMDQSEASPSLLTGATRFLGALASLALVVGIGVWSYKLIVRDVSGVPVVRAFEGPMRIQPDNPGGIQADHQGLAVNAVAAAGTAAPTADRLMLAPRPVELAAEDVPASQVSPQLVSLELDPVEDDKATAAKPAEISEVTAAKPADTAAVDALVEQLTAGVKPLMGEEMSIDGQTKTAALEGKQQSQKPQALPDDGSAQMVEPAVHLAVLTGPGLTKSLRPQLRPVKAFETSGTGSSNPGLASAINAAVTTLASLDVDPDSLPAGTRLAQLGAYDSVDTARAEWDKLNLRFETYLEGKQRVIQKASSGGRTFYRLRVMGFDDLSAARRFCSALVSESADCIPVTTR
jgi:hypothetical protein